jgi:SNF2 family DNA or RNA helicase
VTRTIPLHDYQIRAIRACKDLKTLFLAIDLGLGKTRIAIEATKDLPLPTLVVAPLRVTYMTWPDELKKWAPEKKFFILHGPDKKDLVNYTADYYLINYDGLKWFFQEIKSGNRKFNLVLDESSFIKSPKAMRFKMLRANLKRFPTYRLCLSASPSPNGLQDIWSQYYMLDEGKRLNSYFGHFRSLYFNYSGPPLYKMSPRAGGEAAIKARVQDITFRLDGSDYNKMPPLTTNIIQVELAPPVMEQYKLLQKDFYLSLAEEKAVTAVTAATLSMKLRQFIQGAIYNDDGDGNYSVIHSAKVQALRELLEGSAGQSILCPIQFKFELEILRKAFGKNIPAIAGGVNAKESLQIQQAWNRGEIPLLLCHPASLSHGLNLQHGGHIVCWFGLTWNLEHYQQLIGRLNRQGQQNGVIVHHIIAKGTIDQRVLKALNAKGATQSSFLDSMKALATEYLNK